jgi:hypothetical protein
VITALATSLIAVLLTPEGILVAADTARRSNSGFSVVRKIAVCDERTIAGLTGTLGWSYNLGDQFISVDSLQVVVDSCKKSKATPLTIRKRAEYIAAALLAKSALFPKNGLDRLRGNVLHHLTLAGYEGTVPKVVQVALFRSGGRDNIEIGSWNETQACVTFSGYDSIRALRDGRPPIPRNISDQPEVRAVREASRSTPCLAISAEQAKAFFRTAVSVSLDYAQRFERPFPRGDVNWPIDLAVVRRTRVDPILRENR